MCMTTIDQVLAEKLNGFYINEWPIGNLILCVIALSLCVLLCGIIGLEREKRGRSAGLRTHLLVGVGSCLVMIISIYGFPLYSPDGTKLTHDIARLAAQVVTGVGFLGAGAIIHRNSTAKGLTTAATIWMVMAIGIACGSFNFFLAIITTLLILIVLTLFIKIENKVSKNHTVVLIKTDGKTAVLKKIHEVAEQFGYELSNFDAQTFENGELDLTFSALIFDKETKADKFLEALEEIDGIISASFLLMKK